jgi:hypothetical protein
MNALQEGIRVAPSICQFDPLFMDYLYGNFARSLVFPTLGAINASLRTNMVISDSITRELAESQFVSAVNSVYLCTFSSRFRSSDFQRCG